jgi:hypothetical protein
MPTNELLQPNGRPWIDNGGSIVDINNITSISNIQPICHPEVIWSNAHVDLSELDMDLSSAHHAVHTALQYIFIFLPIGFVRDVIIPNTNVSFRAANPPIITSLTLKEFSLRILIILTIFRSGNE